MEIALERLGLYPVYEFLDDFGGAVGRLTAFLYNHRRRLHQKSKRPRIELAKLIGDATDHIWLLRFPSGEEIAVMAVSDLVHFVLFEIMEKDTPVTKGRNSQIFLFYRPLGAHDFD